MSRTAEELKALFNGIKGIEENPSLEKVEKFEQIKEVLQGFKNTKPQVHKKSYAPAISMDLVQAVITYWLGFLENPDPAVKNEKGERPRPLPMDLILKFRLEFLEKLISHLRSRKTEPVTQISFLTQDSFTNTLILMSPRGDRWVTDTITLKADAQYFPPNLKVVMSLESVTVKTGGETFILPPIYKNCIASPLPWTIEVEAKRAAEIAEIERRSNLIKSYMQSSGLAASRASIQRCLAFNEKEQRYYLQHLRITSIPDILKEKEERENRMNASVWGNAWNSIYLQVVLYVQLGASVNLSNEDGVTLLMMAASQHSTQHSWLSDSRLDVLRIVHFLLANQADPNLRDVLGRTALMYVGLSSPRELLFASYFKYGEELARTAITQALLGAGADPTLTDYLGNTALDYLKEDLAACKKVANNDANIRDAENAIGLINKVLSRLASLERDDRALAVEDPEPISLTFSFGSAASSASFSASISSVSLSSSLASGSVPTRSY